MRRCRLPPWCQSVAPGASADSLSLSLIFVPSEYAQVKARTILADSNYQALSKEMAADLGVPAQYVQPNAYLVRAGGYFQPEGVARPQRPGLLGPRRRTLADQHLRRLHRASEPANWAASSSWRPPKSPRCARSACRPTAESVKDALGAEVRAEVARRLDAIEREDGVRILFAAESGSRAWGFASPDSDYDVRFVYVRPLDDYLQLSPPRDVIETPIEGVWDVNGWDLKKALLLLRKGNAVVVEWLRSPLVYREVGPTANAMRRLAEHFADPESSIRHYGGLMHGLVERSLSGREQVKLKAYIYVMRCACAVAWVRARGTVPPMALAELRANELPMPVSARLRMPRWRRRSVWTSWGRARASLCSMVS